MIKQLGILSLFISSLAFGGWTEWYSLGGPVDSDPSACSIGKDGWVFVKGQDNGVWGRYRDYTNGTWGNWFKIPDSNIIASPAVTCTNFGTPGYSIDVVAQGMDRALWHTSFNGNIWTPWQSLGGVVDKNSGPAISSNAIGKRLDVFVRGTDQQLFQKTRYDGSWSAWIPLGGKLRSDPAATMWSQGRLDVFALDWDFNLLHKFMENGGWNPWTAYPGAVTSSPEAVHRGVGVLNVYARGTDYSMWERVSVNGVWGEWQSLGGYFLSGPGAFTYTDAHRVMVFGRGSDNNLWYKAWAP